MDQACPEEVLVATAARTGSPAFPPSDYACACMQQQGEQAAAAVAEQGHADGSAAAMAVDQDGDARPLILFDLNGEAPERAAFQGAMHGMCA